MTDFAACAAEIRAAIGRNLSKEEAAILGDILKGFDRKQRQARTLAAGGDAEASVLKAADEMASQMETAALVQKRNAALALRKRLETVDFIRSQFGDDPALGLEAVLVGVNRAREGSRFSAALQQRELRGAYLGGVVADLEAAGLRELLASGTLDRDITRALWSLDNPEAGPFRGAKEAQEIASIMRKWQEASRVDANKAGAWIGRLPGYVVRQSHDLHRIMSAGYEAWRDRTLPLLDLERTMGDRAGSVEEFMRAVYDGLASGVHLKAVTASGGKGPRSIARALSEERVLHYRDADAWYAYNEQFGTGNLREAFFAGLERAASATGLMRALGPNPGATLDAVADDLMRSAADAAGRRGLRNFTAKKMGNLLAEVDGSVRIPASAMGARVSANLRRYRTFPSSARPLCPR